jgi:hypothetical protein
MTQTRGNTVRINHPETHAFYELGTILKRAFFLRSYSVALVHLFLPSRLYIQTHSLELELNNIVLYSQLFFYSC